MGEVTTELHGRVLVATLSNPPHGLMDRGVVEGLEQVVRRAEGDEAVGAVVLTGAHRERFIAHYDVSELLAGARTSPALGRRAAQASLRAVGAARAVPPLADALARTPAAGLVELERFHALLLGMNRSGAVFVAALNGSALGGGCELALACDQRLMADGDHVIGQPEILFGFPPGGGGTQRLARLLGPSRALRLVVEGTALTPAEAAGLGLVDEVVPGPALRGRAIELATRLGSRIKTAVAAAKRAVYEGGSQPLADGLLRERAEFLATVATPEAMAAMAAYVEQLERTGELPAYDAESRRRALESGRFT